MTNLTALSFCLMASLLTGLAEPIDYAVHSDNFEKDNSGLSASVQESNGRPRKPWTRVGPLGETPRHVTDAYPLSDQQNKGAWSKFEPLSDEFEGKELDGSKWTVGMSWWKGRQPALFSDKNIRISDGKLHLTMRKEPVPPQVERLGYHDYTSAASSTCGRGSENEQAD